MVKRTAISSFDELAKKVRRFAKERDWEQFHSPKNLSMALTVECAELMEHFQWLTDAQSRRLSQRQRTAIELELADIQIYLIRLAQVLNVDILTAGARKLLINARKYPIERARGSAKKYT